MRKNRAFTLTELLIVMGIIVLVVAVAVPSFRAITGGRSVEAAQNQLAAFIQRARQEAIGVQEMRGVAFIMATDADRPTAVMVREVARPAPTSPGEFAAVDVWLDVVSDRDAISLPAGVGFQMIDNTIIKPPAAAATPDPSDDVRDDDAYIGMNRYVVNMSTTPTTEFFRFAGVILFDGFGRVVNKEYAFACYRGGVATDFANLMHMTVQNSIGFRPGLPPSVPPKSTDPPPTLSAVGFALFDQDAFDSLNFTAGDRQCDTNIDGGAKYADVNETTWQSTQTGRTPEAIEERWLDANATPILVNRNNGTLLRGQ
jgi:prepilin-type N-terminal cleavage/methylation domain-containing protein